jgi:hypothetical protein
MGLWRDWAFLLVIGDRPGGPLHRITEFAVSTRCSRSTPPSSAPKGGYQSHPAIARRPGGRRQHLIAI